MYIKKVNVAVVSPQLLIHITITMVFDIIIYIIINRIYLL